MTPTTERAVLAGGCFWGVQELVRTLPGVLSTRVGYTGGDVPNATYRNHGTHAEAIEIVFDPMVTSYRDLLELFFQIHDPTTRNRQGNDVGMSYRSALYFTSDEQRTVAEDTIADVEASSPWPGKVVTELEPVGPFWEAEPEHQDYLQRYPHGYTCHFVRPNWTLPRRLAASQHSRQADGPDRSAGGQDARIPAAVIEDPLVGRSLEPEILSVHGVMAGVTQDDDESGREVLVEQKPQAGSWSGMWISFRASAAA